MHRSELNILSEFHEEVRAHSSRTRTTKNTVRNRKIYIAARFDRREELGPIVSQLEAAGAEVVSRWVKYEGAKLGPQELSPARRGGESAQMDLHDLQQADLCIAFTESAGNETGRGGRHTELGIAIGIGIDLIVIGPREHVFHCLESIQQFDSWESASAKLGLGVARDELAPRDSRAVIGAEHL